MTTVLVADDHPTTRLGIRAALEDDGFDVVEAGNAAGAVAVAREIVPDICLVDVNMPGDGIAAARQIARDVAGTTVVMLTASRDDEDLFEAVRAGAVGYLLKDMDPDRLAPALRGVLAGEAALPRGLALSLMREFRGRDDRRLLAGRRRVRLTEREWEILHLLARGSTTEQIATELVISAVTVRTHVSAILQKLRVPDRAAAVRLFRDR